VSPAVAVVAPEITNLVGLPRSVQVTVVDGSVAPGELESLPA